LRGSAEIGLAEIPHRYEGSDRDYLLNSIRYELDERAMMGLRRFAALACAAGLVQNRDISLYEPELTVRQRPEGLDALLGRGADGATLSQLELEQLTSSARLSDLATAAKLRSLPSRWDELILVQRLDLSVEAPELLHSLSQGRELGAESYVLEGLGGLSQETASRRFEGVVVHESGLWIRGFTQLEDLRSAWGIERAALLDWLMERGLDAVIGVDPSDPLLAQWGDLLMGAGMSLNLSLYVKPSESPAEFLEALSALRELLGSLEAPVSIEIECGCSGTRRASAVEGLNALALTRLAVPVEHSLRLGASWGAAVSVAGMGMGASQLGRIFVDPDHPTSNGEALVSLIAKWQREWKDSSPTGLSPLPPTGAHEQVTRA
jgi:hypothetical protein